jgi:hypothetical protein
MRPRGTHVVLARETVRANRVGAVRAFCEDRMSATRGEVFVDFPVPKAAGRGEPLLVPATPSAPLSRVKSTLLVASLRRLREMGREADYLSALPSEHREAIVESVAGSWVGVEVALAHYEACEALGLTDSEQVDVGRLVGERLRGTLLGTVVRMAKEGGMTPWAVIPHFPRLWSRLFGGSTLSAWKVGPKEARLECAAMPLVDVRYFRNALRGQAQGLIDLFCARSYVTPIHGRNGIGWMGLRVQWV